jgi:hypothetical protein
MGTNQRINDGGSQWLLPHICEVPFISGIPHWTDVISAPGRNT